MTEQDYYELLGVQRGADDATIKAAYRRMAKEHHPDRKNGCKESEAHFKAINQAYDVLKDPQKRAAYDRFGHAPALQNGAIVVPFFEATNVDLNDCTTTPLDRDLLKDIIQHPQDYYVNVHNADFPGGAIRGQMSK